MNKPTIEYVHVVGCGGVASYLLPVLLKTFSVFVLVLHDGDTLEERNLDRQLFSTEQVGMNKAEALADLMRKQGHADLTVEVVPEFFSTGTPVNPYSLIISCADNHAAKAAILAVADMNMCDVVIAANEYTDSSAAFYQPQWKDGPFDPRVRYPELLTNHSNDPLRPESCQGAAQESSPQLAAANFGAAHYAMQLLWFYRVEGLKLSKGVAATHSPVEHSNNFNRTRTVFTGGLN